jgi:hypothetical protein
MNFDVLFGSIQVEERSRWEGEHRQIFECRSIHRDRDGRIERITDWEAISTLEHGDVPDTAPYADVKIFAILAAIVVVIFTFAVIGAMDVYDHVHGWLST